MPSGSSLYFCFPKKKRRENSRLFFIIYYILLYFVCKAIHKSLDSLWTNLKNLSIVGKQTVGFILNIGHLSINKTTYSERNKRLDFLAVELYKCVFVFFCGFKTTVAILIFTENMTLYAVRITTKFADNDRSSVLLADLNLLKVYVS